MKNELILSTNNGNTVSVAQYEASKKIFVTSLDARYNVNYEYSIMPEDFTMLLNMYCYVKRNDIKNDFINPNGKNKEEGV